MLPVHRTSLAAIALALGALAPSCVAPYSRVGGTSHRKLYRGQVAEVGKAVQKALTNRGYPNVERVPREDGEDLQATPKEGKAVTVTIRLQDPGWLEVALDTEMDWREAIVVHRGIGEELGLFRRLPR